MQRVLPSGNGSGVNQSFNNVVTDKMPVRLSIIDVSRY